ncbi:MAG: glycosyltransferase [Muribaculaceae bacterium]|nr:glycosyltransferase [Muribaculaceae bacterium]
MKRILLLIDDLISGGAQRQIVGLAKLLHDEGYELKLIYYHPIEFYKQFLDDNCVDNECIAGASDSRQRIFRIASAISKYRPEVVISYLQVPSIIACLIKLFGQKYRLIVSERNTTQILTAKERIKFFLMKWADEIVPNSYSQQHYIERNFPSLGQKVTTITNFVDTDYFSPIEYEYRGNPRIVTVARVAEQKNVKSYIEAIRILKFRGYNFTIDWYGYTSETYYAECMELLKEYQLTEIFRFHKPTTSILREYQCCDAFCLPSIYEGFPNVVCEAMSCGKPILCSNICDNPEIVDDGKNGFLFDPHNIDDMVDKIERFLLLEKVQKICMGERSRELSLAKFSARTFLEKYKALIEK